MKLKLVTLLTFTLINAQSQAQNGQLKVGLVFSPDYCTRKIVNTAADPSLNPAIDALDRIDDFKFGFTTGLTFEYPIHKHYSLGSGVLFSDKGFQTKEIPLTTSDHPDGIGFGHSVYHFQYIDIPLMVYRHMRLNDKNRFNAGIGLGNSFNLGNYEKFYVRNGDSYTQITRNSGTGANMKHYFPSLLVSVGFEHQINDIFSYKIEPILRQSMLSMNKDPFKYYLNSIGLNLGLAVKW